MKIFYPQNSGLDRHTIQNLLNGYIDELDLPIHHFAIDDPRLTDAVCQAFADRWHDVEIANINDEDAGDDQREMVKELANKLKQFQS